MKTLKTEKELKMSFSVTSQKPHKLIHIYITDNQKYSDNKHLNKVHNIIKGLSKTLNCNK